MHLSYAQSGRSVTSDKSGVFARPGLHICIYQQAVSSMAGLMLEGVMDVLARLDAPAETELPRPSVLSSTRACFKICAGKKQEFVCVTCCFPTSSMDTI